MGRLNGGCLLISKNVAFCTWDIEINNHFSGEIGIEEGDMVGDLGEIVAGSFKFGRRWGTNSKSSNRTLGFIKRISSRVRDILMPLYRGLVREKSREEAIELLKRVHVRHHNPDSGIRRYGLWC